MPTPINIDSKGYGNKTDKPDTVLARIESESFTVMFDELLSRWDEIRNVRAYIEASLKNLIIGRFCDKMQFFLSCHLLDFTFSMQGRWFVGANRPKYELFLPLKDACPSGLPVGFNLRVLEKWKALCYNIYTYISMEIYASS